ncbi:MAG: alginate export family protein [Candidatus Desulfofervidaceae bacterium]|nr:alginate export family protein [Candidatus Desulfofervidaceae bacterium]
MRKCLLWLLAATLVVAMAMPALADVNISGSYRLRGVYYEPGAPDTNLSFYDNRLRFDVVAKVSDNLTMFIQADSGLGYDGHEETNPLANQDSYDGILSQHYGADRDTSTHAHDIVFQRAYFKYDSPIGTFQVGRQWAFWGKGMLISMNRNRVKYVYKQPGYFLGCGLDKWDEGLITDDTDDKDHYFAFGSFSNLVEGLTWSPWFGFIHGPGSKSEDYDVYYTSQALKYVMDKWAVNIEFDYKWGNTQQDPKVKVRQYCIGADASYDLDIAKVGAEFAFFSGESAADKNKKESSAGGKSKTFHSSYWYAPFVIFGELPIGPELIAPDGTAWSGSNTHKLANCYYFKVYATASPIENLEVTGAIGYIQADEARAVKSGSTWYDTGADNMGWEFDLIGTYKITDNLSYSVVGAYFTAGDYFDKYTVNSSGNVERLQESDDAYVLLHQIQINF